MASPGAGSNAPAPCQAQEARQKWARPQKIKNKRWDREQAGAAWGERNLSVPPRPVPAPGCCCTEELLLAPGAQARGCWCSRCPLAHREALAYPGLLLRHAASWSGSGFTPRAGAAPLPAQDRARLLLVPCLSCSGSRKAQRGEGSSAPFSSRGWKVPPQVRFEQPNGSIRSELICSQTFSFLLFSA